MKSIHLNYRGDVGPQFLGGPNTKNFQKGDQMLNNFRKSGKIAKISVKSPDFALIVAPGHDAPAQLLVYGFLNYLKTPGNN